MRLVFNLIKGSFTKNPQLSEGRYSVTPEQQQVVANTINPISEEFSQPERYFNGLTPEQAMEFAESPNHLMFGAALQSGRPDDEGWRTAYSLMQRGVDVSPSALANIPDEDFTNVPKTEGVMNSRGTMSGGGKPILRGFPQQLNENGLMGLEGSVAKNMKAYGKHVMTNYGGDVSNIWNDNPDYPTLHKRLAQLPYFGEWKKAPMTADLLARMGYVEPDESWHTDADPSMAGPHGLGSHPTIDSHIARHFARMMTDNPAKQLYLTENASQGASAKHIVPFARALHKNPAWAHPGWWQHARDTCKSGTPSCEGCEFAPSGLCAHGAKKLGLPQPKGYDDSQIPESKNYIAPVTPQVTPLSPRENP
jgi:hypothetical protein